MNRKYSEDQLYPLEIAYSVPSIIERHNNIVEKVGEIEFVKYQRAVEMYQAARYSGWLTYKTGRHYWITPNKPGEFPDIYLLSCEQDKKIIEGVELTRWEEHVEDLWDVIDKKISKNYVAGCDLVVHLTPKNNNIQSKYIAERHEELKKRKISFLSVRLWMAIERQDKDTLVGEIFPSDQYTEFALKHWLDSSALTPQIAKVKIMNKKEGLTYVLEKDTYELPAL